MRPLDHRRFYAAIRTRAERTPTSPLLRPGSLPMCAVCMEDVTYGLRTRVHAAVTTYVGTALCTWHYERRIGAR